MIHVTTVSTNKINAEYDATYNSWQFFQCSVYMRKTRAKYLFCRRILFVNLH
jgi:hypothetical protein